MKRLEELQERIRLELNSSGDHIYGASLYDTERYLAPITMDSTEVEELNEFAKKIKDKYDDSSQEYELAWWDYENKLIKDHYYDFLPDDEFPPKKLWYAICSDEDNDWGTGFETKEEAMAECKKYNDMKEEEGKEREYFIAVIDGNYDYEWEPQCDAVCVEEFDENGDER